jgi:opacity protein-like surface antigen
MKKLLGAATLLTLAVGVSPAMAQVGSGVYFRVDAGGGFSTNMTFTDTNAFAPNRTLGGVTYSGDSGRSPLASGGLGVRLSPMFRVDLTASYMPWFRFDGGSNSNNGTLAGAKIKPRVGLVNGYVDFGGLAGLPASSAQPYLVASVGAARNQLDNVSITAGNSTLLTVNGRTTTDVAWGLGTGIGFPLGRFVTFDLMYKYLDLGKVQSSTLVTAGGVTTQGTPIAAQLHVHTITAGFRVGF